MQPAHRCCCTVSTVQRRRTILCCLCSETFYPICLYFSFWECLVLSSVLMSLVTQNSSGLVCYHCVSWWSVTDDLKGGNVFIHSVTAVLQNVSWHGTDPEVKSLWSFATLVTVYQSAQLNITEHCCKNLICHVFSIAPCFSFLLSSLPQHTCLLVYI